MILTNQRQPTFQQPERSDVFGLGPLHRRPALRRPKPPQPRERVPAELPRVVQDTRVGELTASQLALASRGTGRQVGGMATLAEAATRFLEQRRIAVVGVSRDTKQPANFNYRKLRDSGRTVFAVNPATAEVEGGPCYPTLRAVPGGVDAVLLYTPSAATAGVIRECAALGIQHVWIHRSFGQGSWSAEAEALGREHGLTLIPGGCPAMFCAPDPGHRCFRWMLGLFGKLPQEIAVR